MPQIEPKTVRFNEEEIRLIEQLLEEKGQPLLKELARRHSSPVLLLLPEGELPSSFSEVVRLLVRVALREVYSLKLERQYERSASVMAEAMNPQLVASITEMAWSTIPRKFGRHSPTTREVPAEAEG